MSRKRIWWDWNRWRRSASSLLEKYDSQDENEAHSIEMHVDRKRVLNKAKNFTQRIFFSSLVFWRCFRMEGLVVEFFVKVDDDAWLSSLMQWGWYYHLPYQSWTKSLKKFAKSVLNRKLEELCQISRGHKTWRTLPNQSWTKSLRNFAKWVLNKSLRNFARWILNTKNLRNLAKWVLNQKLKKLNKMSPEQRLERNFAKWVLNITSLRNFAKTSPEQKLENFAKWLLNKSLKNFAKWVLYKKLEKICQVSPKHKRSRNFAKWLNPEQKAWETFPM